MRNVTLPAVVALTLLIIPAAGAIAQEGSGAEQADATEPVEGNPWSEPPDLKDLAGRTLVATGFVIALAIGTLVVLRILARPTRVGATSNPDDLSLVASLSLPNRTTLLLVRARQTDVLVTLDGSGAKSVVVLPTPLAEGDWEGQQETESRDGVRERTGAL